MTFASFYQKPCAYGWRLTGAVMTIDEIEKPRVGDLCLVCGGAPSIIGVFVPENSSAWGGKSGGTRFFRYCLCQKCHGRADTPERVEKIIRVELDSGRAIYRGGVYAN